MTEPDPKPELILMAGPFTADKIAEMYRRLTGKEPTAEEMEELRAGWDARAHDPPDPPR